jgi:hypothetical protein
MASPLSQTALKTGYIIERIVDRLGVLFLLGLGLTTAGATLLAGA